MALYPELLTITHLRKMRRRYDHIDLRVPHLGEVTPFYELLLPALGFTRDVRVEGWLQFEAGDGDITEFFGVTESPAQWPTRTGLPFGRRV